MLRATTSSLVRSSNWKTQTVNCFRSYATSDDTKNPESQVPLSQRLGGTGRGRILDGATDPFAAFLANAKTNRNRNGNFTPRPRKQKQNNNNDQFADAESTTTTPAAAASNASQSKQPRQNNNRPNNNRPNNRTQNKQVAGDSNNYNNNNKRQQVRGGKKLNVRRSAPQEVRTRRATTFIDKDIDWSSFETTQLTATENVEEAGDNHELVLKDMQGDYDRYLGVGSDVKWSDVVEGSAVSTLVGSNSTFDIQQKTAFLAAVSKATGGQVAARK